MPEPDAHRANPTTDTTDVKDILERISDAFYALDHEWRFTYVNSQAEKLVMRTRMELLGKCVWDEFPEAVGSGFDRQYRKAMAEQTAVSIEEYFPPLDTWFDVRAYPSPRGLSVFFQDVGARKREEQKAEASLRRTEEELQAAHDRTSGILESVTDGFYAIDREWRFTYVNAQAARLLFRTRDELIGRNIWEVFPEAVGGSFYQFYHRAIAEGVPLSLEDYYEPLDSWMDVRAFPSPEGLSVFFQNVNERKMAQDSLRASEEALRENEKRLQDAQARLKATLSAGGIATWTWDIIKDLVIADACLASLFSVSPEEAANGGIDVYLQAIHPEDRPRVAEAIKDAITQGDTYETEYRVVMPSGSHRWLAARGRVERDGDGIAASLPGVVLDITDRAERGRRERFLAELAERARRTTDPDAVIVDALRAVGQFLGVARCVFADIDIDADTCTIPSDYCADDTVASMKGTFPISAFGPYLVAAYRAGRTVVVEDVHHDEAQVPTEYVSAYEAVACRAFIAVPVLHSDRLVSVIAIHSVTPRRWEADEVALLQTLVERTWLTVEVLRQDRALAKEIEERRIRAEREAVLNRIGHSLRGSNDPKTVLETAVRQLGEALGADRCYYASYNRNADTAVLRPDWRREGLPSIEGDYVMSHYTINRDLKYQTGQTQVLADTAGDPALLKLGIQALVRVPLASGSSMTALAVAMSGGPRDWTPDEVSLIESVATQTQTALEAVRVQRREHNIAEQLQNALQPQLPKEIAKLDVGSVTRPALDEASVGGDFMDVFPLDKNLYGIVIGDVSGKGLAAAQQIALIRNSLRTVLYLYRAPAQAAAALNSIVTTHDLLPGFVTAWIGVYDASAGEISYCSCGHEPALIKRASGSVEALATTGPPLGVADNAKYEERLASLRPHDALILYTDGLSEAGPSRRDLLGTDGLIRMLLALPLDASAQSLAERLVAEASAFAKGVFRDDVAVLLARHRG
ncbi:hypothetical protein CCAX7_36110 [Capsulimonas corticalis]|uniref:Uncharacterized protein n=1 Tax=Capsulimonas corticalis TaxID=2219043 RepID=A0A402D6X7_9BACT|nr:SpoIIE family protein phosphatase [Capsulimonas corticalis]BDI31560.1 hypothetical protein CCAX7_36110 [Capsulimonas corticalis]